MNDAAYESEHIVMDIVARNKFLAELTTNAWHIQPSSTKRDSCLNQSFMSGRSASYQIQRTLALFFWIIDSKKTQMIMI